MLFILFYVSDNPERYDITQRSQDLMLSLREGDWGILAVSTLIHIDFFPLIGYR